MKLSNRTDYALRALVEISLVYGDGEYISAKEISERQDISLKYLEQILTSLKRSGFIESRQGINGGYTLARKPEDITFGAVIRSIEGSLAPLACVDNKKSAHAPINWKNRFQMVMTNLRDAIDNVVDNTTLADICH